MWDFLNHYMRRNNRRTAAEPHSTALPGEEAEGREPRPPLPHHGESSNPPASLPALPAPSRAPAEGNAFTPPHSAYSHRRSALPVRTRDTLRTRSVRAGEKAGRKCLRRAGRKWCWRRKVPRRAGGQVPVGRGAGLRGSRGRAAGGARRASRGLRCPVRHRPLPCAAYPPDIPAPRLCCGNSAPALTNPVL